MLAHVGRTVADGFDFGDDQTLVLQVHAPDADNFGQAVDAALRDPKVCGIPGAVRAKWFWLIHDDMVARPDALQRMLRLARPSASIAVVGPKQLDYDDPSRLLELGIRATGSSRRIEDIEFDEIDQGQYDSRHDVLAVGTAGMLVRKAVWDSVGGLDPALGPFGDGLELGRRVHWAGYRVVVAPDAEVLHRQSSRVRESGDSGAFQERRAAQLYNWLISVTPWKLPFIVAWLPFLALFRAFGRLLTRRPRLALAEITAYLELVAMTGFLVQGRRRVSSSASVPRSAISELHESPLEVSRARRMKRKIAGQKKLQAADLDQGAINTLRRHRFRASGTLLAALLAVMVFSVVVWRSYLGGISGGQWGNLPSSWHTLVAQGLGGWQLSGDGAAGPTSPILMSLALVTAPFALFGIAPIVVAPWLVFLAVPLALCGGWLLMSTLTHSIPIRLAGALAWAGSAALMVSLIRGELPTTLAILALPVVLTGMIRGLGPTVPRVVQGVSQVVIVPRGDRSSWLAVAGLSMLFVGTRAPILIPIVVLLGVAIAAFGTTGASVAWANVAEDIDLQDLPANPSTGKKAWGIAVVALPALIWVLPALISNVFNLDRGQFLEWAAGSITPTGQSATWWQFLAGYQTNPLGFSPGSVNQVPWVSLAAAGGLSLLFMAVAGLVLSLFSPVGLRVTPVIAFLTAVIMWLLSQSISSASFGTAETPLLMAVATLALLTVVGGSPAPLVVGERGIRGDRRSTSFALARGLGGGVVAVGSACTLTALLVLGAVGPLFHSDTETDSGLSVAPAESQAFPLIARDAQDGSRRARVVELSMSSGQIHVSLLRGVNVQIADLLLHPSRPDQMNSRAVDAAAESLAQASAELVTGIGEESALKLADHAVDLVLVRADSDGAQDIANTIDATDGFERIGSTPIGTMWRVRPGGDLPSRIWIQSPTGKRTPVDSGVLQSRSRIEVKEDSVLVLAETRDSAWKARFGDRTLEPVQSDRWQQEFRIPPGSGALSIRYDAPYIPWWIGGALLSLAVLVVSSIPLRARRPERAAAPWSDDQRDLVEVINVD